jgi:hypothetical protein
MGEHEGLAAALEAAVAGGDLGKLSAAHRLRYYVERCRAAGLDPATKPFDYIKTQQGITLYAGAGAADQIAARRRLSVDILSRTLLDDGLYEVVCRCREPDKTTDNIGIVNVLGLKGEALANGMMKAVTKARRRAILSHCGLGMLDVTETETIPGATRIQVDHETGEVLGELPEPAAPAACDREYCKRRAFAAWKNLGWDSGAETMRAYCSTALGKEVTTRTTLTAEEWRLVYQALESELAQADAEAVEDQAAVDTEATPTPPEVPATAPGWKERAKAAMESGATYAQQAGF